MTKKYGKQEHDVSHDVHHSSGADASSTHELPPAIPIREAKRQQKDEGEKKAKKRDQIHQTHTFATPSFPSQP
jgi:hypothetical protein